MKVNDVYVSSLGVYLPEEVYPLCQAVAEGLADAERAAEDDVIGVRVADDLWAPEMAARAAQQAFERTDVPREAVDLILYASVWHQGPDGWCAPSYVQRAVVGGNAPTVEIRSGCNGMFSALQLAASHLSVAPEHTATLLLAAENFGSQLIDRWRTTAPSMYLGDGGSAVLLTKRPGFARLLSVDTITVPELEELHRSGEPLFPPGATTLRPLDFTNRAAHFVENSAAAAEMRVLIAKAQQELHGRWRADTGLDFSDITYVGYMNSSRHTIEERVLSIMGLPLSRTTWQIGRDMGHLGASDQIVAMERLVGRGALQPGDHYLMYGVGPGMSIAAAVFEIVDWAPWAR